jgi:cytochrome c oxidase assembly protein subunit 11
MMDLPTPRPKPPHNLIAGLVFGTSLVMLGMSFAAVPLYRMFCAATGFGGTTQVALEAPKLRGQRVLTVRFDANVAPGLAWKFVPDVSQIRLRTGETTTVFFKVTNLTARETSAQAMYNVSPDVSGAYFDKISCFCFTEQHLGPHETMDMPVVFFLDPALEKDKDMKNVAEVTLSYTFFAAQGAKTAASEPTGTKPQL